MRKWQACIISIMVLSTVIRSTFASETLSSPSGELTATIKVSGNRLYYSLDRNSVSLIEDSPLGVIVDGIDLGSGVNSVSGSALSVVNETYAMRGTHPTAVNHYHEKTITADRTGAGDSSLVILFRLSDDGIAYRYQIPGSGIRTISGETSGWLIPADTQVWHQASTTSYEGMYYSAVIGNFGTDMGPPIVCHLPYNDGYLLISESDVQRYSGMTCHVDHGSRMIQSAFLDDNQWSVPAGSYSPWRVTITAIDLNGLVNSDLIRNLASPPDPALFPDGIHTSWIRPGRSLWSWWPDFTVDWNKQKIYADKASELGMEYILIDEKWEEWSDGSKDKWDLVTEVVDHARPLGVNVNIWKTLVGNQRPRRRLQPDA